MQLGGRETIRLFLKPRTESLGSARTTLKTTKKETINTEQRRYNNLRRNHRTPKRSVMNIERGRPPGRSCRSLSSPALEWRSSSKGRQGECGSSSDVHPTPRSGSTTSDVGAAFEYDDSDISDAPLMDSTALYRECTSKVQKTCGCCRIADFTSFQGFEKINLWPDYMKAMEVLCRANKSRTKPNQ